MKFLFIALTYLLVYRFGVRNSAHSFFKRINTPLPIKIPFIKPLSFLILITLFSTACNKDKTVYSTWTINNKEIYNAEVYASTGCNGNNSICVAEMSANLPTSGFNLAFSMDHFPTEGQFPFYGSVLGIVFYYKGNQYNHTSSKIDTIYASSKNGKIRYLMPPCWFINYYDHNDSILAAGTFNLP